MTARDIAFLVEKGWSYSDLMNMPLTEVGFWSEQAVKLHNELNKTDGKEP